MFILNIILITIYHPRLYKINLALLVLSIVRAVKMQLLAITVQMDILEFIINFKLKAKE